jgi:hypothetical protein
MNDIPLLTDEEESLKSKEINSEWVKFRVFVDPICVEIYTRRIRRLETPMYHAGTSVTPRSAVLYLAPLRS